MLYNADKTTLESLKQLSKQSTEDLQRTYIRTILTNSVNDFQLGLETLRREAVISQKDAQDAARNLVFRQAQLDSSLQKSKNLIRKRFTKLRESANLQSNYLTDAYNTLMINAGNTKRAGLVDIGKNLEDLTQQTDSIVEKYTASGLDYSGSVKDVESSTKRIGMSNIMNEYKKSINQYNSLIQKAIDVDTAKSELNKSIESQIESESIQYEDLL